MLTLTLLLAAAPWPAGTVVLGASSVEGTATEVVALTPAGERHAIGVVEHAAGHLPKGVLQGDRLLITLATAGADGAVVEEVRLRDGARTVLAHGALAAVPPAVDGAGEVLFVRQAAAERFELVRARDGAVRAWLDAAWVQPARGRAGTFLVVEREGGARLVALTSTGLSAVASPGRSLDMSLGKGPARSPVHLRARVVVEVADPAPAHGRARVLELPSGKVLRAGLAGMDPVALDDTAVAYGAGTKAAAVIVEDDAGARVLRAPRAGVAHPLAGARVGGRALVIAWLERGAGLPGELWAFSDDETRPVLAPAVGAAVEVYGVVTP